MDYLCEAWRRVKRWWSPEKPCLLEPLNPRVTIMDPPPTLQELEKQMIPRRPDIAKVVYFHYPKDKLP